MGLAKPFPRAAPLVEPEEPVEKSFERDLAVRLICPECRDPHPNIVEEFGSGDLVCGNCGLVLGDRIVDTRSEWRTFANDEGDDPSRVGAASDPLLEGMEQLNTVISFRDGGSGLAAELSRAASRGQRSRAEQNLLSAFRDISTWCDQFSLPKTIADIAKQLYKRTDEERLLRGKAHGAVTAACIFIACRQAHVPRTFREICAMTRVSKKQLGRCYKELEQAFNLAPGAAAAAQSSSPEGLLARWCNFLDLDRKMEAKCAHVVGACRRHAIADGRSHLSLVGGVIYFTCMLLAKRVELARISEVAGVTEGTIKQIYRIFWAEKEKLVKQEWLDSGLADMSRLIEPARAL